MPYSYQMPPVNPGRFYDSSPDMSEYTDYGVVEPYMPVNNPNVANATPVQQPPVYDTQIYNYPQTSAYTPKSKALQNGAVGVGAGAVVGAGLGLIAKPHIENKTFSDNFAKDIAKKYIEQDSCEFNQFYKNRKEFLKEIKNVKTGEEFVNLLEKYELKGSLGEVTSENEAKLRGITKKRELKRHIANYEKYVDTRAKDNICIIEDKIKSCWSETEKKLVKPEGFDENLFNFIKKSKNKLKFSTIGKGACIGAAVTGVGTYLLTKAAEKSYAKRTN